MGRRRPGVLLVALALAVAPLAVAGPKVVVDPGHGGPTGGARGPGGVLEKEVALQVARRLKPLLEQRLQASVVLTRERDVALPLADRVVQANAARPDLFISIHANSMPTQRQRLANEGVETYFLSAAASGAEARRVAARENAEVMRATPSGGDTLAFILDDLQRAEAHGDASRLAYAVQEGVVGVTGAVDRGVQQAPFFVLTGLEAPAILIEVGFVSHPEESKRLASPAYQDALALGIAEGVERFLQQVKERDKKKKR